ncbi:hypothetical protein ACFYO7_11380 [Nocardia salmonicida]|uniref:hypothetical protein n=1 Tax=Nocardia salmonicida TaxID=53431 RepID=UPI0036C8D0D9
MDRSGFWRFLAFLVVYLVIYLGAGYVIGRVGGHYIDDDLLSSVGSAFLQVTAPLLLGGLVLAALSAYLGWNREIYGGQPIYRSTWMWIAPVIVATPIVLRVLGIDWGRHRADVVALMLATGGVDEVTTDASSGGLLQAAGLFTMLSIISGYVLVLFVRGRVTDQRSS